MASIIKADVWQTSAGTAQTIPVQVKTVAGTNTLDSSASSYQTVLSTTFTPKFANSIILVTWTGHVYKYHSGYTTVPFRLRYGSTEIFFNNYFVYNSVEYMYSGCNRGFVVAPGVGTQTVSFEVNPNGNRSYVYANTHVLTIEEIAQ
jgi:hypothetical protein